MGDDCWCVEKVHAANEYDLGYEDDLHNSDEPLDLDVWYKHSFDERIPLSQNTGVGLTGGLWKAFEGVMRHEQVYDDFSVDRSIQDLMRAEMSNAESKVKMWESGMVDTI